jgi:methyltransferase-like protein
MTTQGAYSYDEVPYDSYPFFESHPDNLAAVAKLLGLNPPPVNRARVLELGSSSGGNIVPMAENLPDAHFIGVELGTRQVAIGRKIVEELGLKNVEIREANILDIDQSYGKFDYIIVHGVYSWVPDNVQDKILAICKENMTPDGVAYISYNTLPGWHMRGMIRDMMRYHATRFGTPDQRLAQSRALLDFLVKAVGDAETPYSVLLKREAEHIANQADYYLYHEHLEDVNSPIYFHQFAERLEKKGLRFLGEASLRMMVPGHYPREIEQILQRVSNNIIQMEQYMDFLRNRTFRMSLVCHGDKMPTYAISPDRLNGLYIGTSLRPKEPVPEAGAAEPLVFPAANDSSVTVRDPLVKAAMLEMVAVWPNGIRFEELRETARKRLNPGAPITDAIRAADTGNLGQSLLQMYTAGVARLIEIKARELRLATAVSDKPMVSPLARMQARDGKMATTPKHESVNLGPFEKFVTQRLDGTRNHEALIAELLGAVESGELNVNERGQPVRDPEKLKLVLSTALNDMLGKFVRFGVLVG